VVESGAEFNGTCKMNDHSVKTVWNQNPH
jgi:hypothetical protein